MINSVLYAIPIKMKRFKSHGKLLLTGEYVVLDGAKALAFPTTYGQDLRVQSNESHKLYWKSYNELNEVWFEDELNVSDLTSLTEHPENQISIRLQEILSTAKRLNTNFLNSNQGYTIETHQDFNRLWGLGTSSTLINNIANWADIDAYTLLKMTFGGSGYDIACAQHQQPITYQLGLNKEPIIEPASFNPAFKSQLYFVYLNHKQNSRDGIAAYKANTLITSAVISEITEITDAFLNCKTLAEFDQLISSHEDIISKLIGMAPVKLRNFSDFNGAIKSLGAWGGDFVLVTSETNPSSYFKTKGFHTIIPFSEMVKN